jgi:hypothetical protein
VWLLVLLPAAVVPGRGGGPHAWNFCLSLFCLKKSG